jgi:uncharacterized protein GlcG (DUF336 family)
MRYYRVIGTAAAALVFGALSSAGAGPNKNSGGLDPAAIETACASAAKAEDSAVRSGKKTKMWCAVVDREGATLAINATDTGGTPQKPKGSDAWRGSIEIALAKAYSAVAFSSNDQALNTFTLGLLSRPDGGGDPGQVGHDTGPAPLWGIGNSNPYRPVTGTGGNPDDALNKYHHGIITFAGGEPVYDCSGHLLGAVGVSGDGVDQDDAVATAAVTGANFCTAP